MGPLRRALAFVLAVMLTASLVAPALAGAQGASPFQPLPQAAPDAQPTTPTTTGSGSTSNGDLSTSSEILIFVAGILLLTLIVFFIWRDARRRAPLKAGETGHDESVSSTPHRKKAQSRAKAKRAKAARRRNR